MAKKKLNQELIDKACEYLVDGNYAVVVCRLLGISEECWYSWIRKANVAIEEGKMNIYVHFYESILKAEAEAEAQAVKNIKQASLTDAKHAQWWLTHKARERWADRIDIEVTTQDKAPDKLELEAEFSKFRSISQTEVLQIEES